MSYTIYEGYELSADGASPIATGLSRADALALAKDILHRAIRDGRMVVQYRSHEWAIDDSIWLFVTKDAA